MRRIDTDGMRARDIVDGVAHSMGQLREVYELIEEMASEVGSGEVVSAATHMQQASSVMRLALKEHRKAEAKLEEAFRLIPD
ncbi:hypothetical protein [Sphingosinicella sp.]|uniref:hypothetical protein n=1 Tax=Sphingosinicella sp. TaxID=1917971 RepID=UPI0026069289|nr:hypothetical protein [Sphingosinicella sp.]